MQAVQATVSASSLTDWFVPDTQAQVQGHAFTGSPVADRGGCAGNKEQRTRRLVEHLIDIGRWAPLDEGQERRLDMTFWTNQQLVFLLEKNGMKALGASPPAPRAQR